MLSVSYRGRQHYFTRPVWKLWIWSLSDQTASCGDLGGGGVFSKILANFYWREPISAASLSTCLSLSRLSPHVPCGIVSPLRQVVHASSAVLCAVCQWDSRAGPAGCRTSPLRPSRQSCCPSDSQSPAAVRWMGRQGQTDHIWPGITTASLFQSERDRTLFTHDATTGLCLYMKELPSHFCYQ